MPHVIPRARSRRSRCCRDQERIIRTSEREKEGEDVARKSSKQLPTGRGRGVAEIGLIDRIGLGQQDDVRSCEPGSMKTLSFIYAGGASVNTPEREVSGARDRERD